MFTATMSSTEANPDSITAMDGTRNFHEDWRTGQPGVVSHGWPPNADLIAFLRS